MNMTDNGQAAAETIAKKFESIREMRDIQGQKGNYDCDDYMIGLYNGLEMAVAIIECREPIFKSTDDVRDRTKVLLRSLLKSVEEQVPQTAGEMYEGTASSGKGGNDLFGINETDGKEHAPSIIP